ncbi:hypothetical protein EGW08_023188 [Elysia chlorotica]|uniref:Sodium/solute symporter n=1 Tax=Elysia chlorotica TaxID=188477 RepID=A0A3S1GZ54_ELYCH|nr:hypothetical protein EGW08_023188 [Elysia chlorotica]
MWTGPKIKVCSQLLAVNVVVPLLHPLRVTSAYEYLELRFNSKVVRLCGTILGQISFLSLMGIVLYGPAIALEAVSGFPLWNSILLISAVAVVYTSIGGMKAVIWTDVFQGSVMIAGIFAILIQGTIDVGGPSQVWNIAADSGRMNVFNFDLDPRVRHTFWNLYVGSVFRGFGLVFSQSSVQRISSTKTTREAKRMVLFTAPMFLISLTIATYVGIVAFSYFQTKGCDPFRSRQISDPNQLMPFTVMDLFHDLPGMSGLFLAALFSASLSTLSSGLSSAAALVWSDMIHPLIGEISENKSTVIIKASGEDPTAFKHTLSSGLSSAAALVWSDMIHPLIGEISENKSTLIIKASAAKRNGVCRAGVKGTHSKAAKCKDARTRGKSASTRAYQPAQIVCEVTGKGRRGGCGSRGSALYLDLHGSEFLTKHPVTSSSTVCTYRQMLRPSTASHQPQRFCVKMMKFIVQRREMEYKANPKKMFKQVQIYVHRSGIELLYTVSYAWISTIGVLTTVLVGNIVSVLTGMNKPGDVNPRYLISASESLLFFLPWRVRRLVSSLGPQYMADEHRDKFDKQAEEEIKKGAHPKLAVLTNKPTGERNGGAYGVYHTNIGDGPSNQPTQGPKHTNGAENKGFSGL